MYSKVAVKINLWVEIADKLNIPELNDALVLIKPSIPLNIYDASLDEPYSQTLDNLLDKTAKQLQLEDNYLKQLFENYASYLSTANDFRGNNVEKSNTYNLLAHYLKSQLLSAELYKDTKRIQLLAQLDVQPWVDDYYSDHALSLTKNFYQRNESALFLSLLVFMAVGVVAGSILTAMFLCPVLIPLVTHIPTILISVGLIITPTIGTFYLGFEFLIAQEKEYNKREKEFQQQLQNEFELFVDKTDELINKLDSTDDTEITADEVAKELVSSQKDQFNIKIAKNQFSLFTAKHSNLEFGFDEVQTSLDNLSQNSSPSL